MEQNLNELPLRASTLINNEVEVNFKEQYSTLKNSLYIIKVLEIKNKIKQATRGLKVGTSKFLFENECRLLFLTKNYIFIFKNIFFEQNVLSLSQAKLQCFVQKQNVEKKNSSHLH
jgi:hypothetical protein